VNPAPISDNRCDVHGDVELLVVCVHLARAEAYDWIADGDREWLCPACATSVESLTEHALVAVCRECAAQTRSAVALRKASPAI